MPADSAADALAAVALFLGCGLGLTLCLPGFAKTGLATRLAFSYLLGVSWIGLFLYIASHLAGIPINGPLVFAAAFLPLAVGAVVAVRSLIARKWHPSRPLRPLRPILYRIGLALLATVISSAVMANALTHPLADWDGRMTWSAQAMFVRDAGSVNAEVLRSPRSFVSHPRYPLLMPLAQLAALEATGSDDERVVRAVYAAFFPVLVLLVFHAARRWAGMRAALLATLALLTIPWIPFGREGGALGAYSDLPLACFFGGGLLLLLQGRPRISQGVAAGLLLAAAVLTKNEGLPETLIALVLAGGIALAAFRRRSRSARPRVVAAAVAFSLVLGAFLLLADWRASIPNRYDEAYLETLSVSTLLSRLARPVSTVPVMVERMLDVVTWGLFWWLAPILFIVAVPTPRRPPALLLMVAAAAPLAIGWLAYSQVAEADYYARVTWSRILLQGAVPIFGLLALAVRRLFRV